MKTKKRFFLKAAGISLAKWAGISLALVMMFAMAFAACDTGTSSSGRTPTVPGGDGDYEAPPVSRIFKSDANGTVELTITEILSASTQTADTQTVDSRTVYSVAAPTSGERFYYAIRVKGYSAPVSSGTVTAGEPVWTFTPYAGESFNMTATGSGASLTFTGNPTITVNGTPITIPTLTVTGGSKDSGTSVIPSGPSAAQQAATALAAKLGSKATVTGDGTVVTLTASIAIPAHEVVTVPDGVTLVVPNSTTLTIASSATFAVASGATLEIKAPDSVEGPVTNNGTIDLGTNATIKASITNKASGTIQTAHATMLDTLLDATNGVTAGTVEVSGTVALPGSETQTVKAGITLKVSAKLTVPSGTGLTLESGATPGKITVASGGELNLSALDQSDDSGAVSLGTGSITVENNGIFIGPDVSTSGGKSPQISWGSGNGIVFNKGSKGYFGPENGSNEYYIGPASAGANYEWDANNPGTVTLKGTELILEGYLTSAKTNYIADKATIKQGAVLTVKDDTELTIATTGGNLVVETGGNVVVNGTLIHDEGSKAELDGTITVEATGIYKDLNSGGGTVWGTGEGGKDGGSVIIKKGAKAYTAAGPQMVSGDTHDATTDPEDLTKYVAFQLTGAADDSLTLTKNGYALNGAATLHGNFGISATDTLSLSATSVLTINTSWDAGTGYWALFVAPGGKILGDVGAKIIIEGGALKDAIYIKEGGASGSHAAENNFYTAEETKISTSPEGDVNNGVYASEGEYVWTANAGGANTAGWKKEAEENE